MAWAQKNPRIGVVDRIESRDSTLAYDSKVVNGLVEQGQEKLRAIKRGGLTVAYTGVNGLGQGIDGYNGGLYGVSGDYLNEYSGAAAPVPTLIAPSVSFGARDGAATVGFLGELWVIGGNNAGGLLNDAWVSINGVTWSQNTALPAALTGRTGAKAVVLNNTLYVMGGQNAAGGFLNDVWSTPDGQAWTQISASAAWLPRADFELLVLGNTIYLAGGQGQPGTSTVPVPGLWHDVWTTTNGTAWSMQNGAAPWIGRRRFGFYSVGSTLYVLGGIVSNTNNTEYANAVADLWSDGGTSGVTWTRVNSNAFNVAGCPMLPFTVITSEGLQEPYGSAIVVTNGAGGTGAVAQRFTVGDDDTYDQEWCDYYDAPTVTFTTVGSLYTSACTFADAANGSETPLQGYGFLDGTAVSGGRGGEVVYDNGTYFYMTTYINGAQANEVWTSPNGINWTLLTASPGYASRSMQAIAYGNIWIIAGSSGGVTFYNDVWAIGGGNSAFALTPTVAGEFYNFNQTSSGIATPLLVFKSAHQGYYFNAALALLTRIVSAQYPAITVFGLVYLDGVFYVMDPNGKIWGSGINDPSTWTALNEIAIQNEPNGGVGIAKCGQFLVGFGQWSCEFFYDNANPAPGSALSANTALAYQVGCANGRSIVEMQASVLWVGQTSTEGAKVYMMQGYSPVVISTPFIDRILQADPLTIIYSFATSHFGHPCYVLTLVTSGVTLVYDFAMQFWYTWTSSRPAVVQPITSISNIGVYTATFGRAVLSTAPLQHGMKDGDPAIVSGVGSSVFNGNFNFNVIDPFTLQYNVTGLGTPQTSGALTPYTTTYYLGVDGHELSNSQAGNIGGSVFVQDPSNGNVYVVSYNTGSDYGNPVDFTAVTGIWDAGQMRDKFITRAAIVGDQTSSNVWIRHSETDYKSWSFYRPVNMQNPWPFISAMGRANRTAYQIRHTDFTPQRVESIELEFEEGV